MIHEDVVETQDDSQKRDIRAILDLLIEEMDTLQMFGLSRSFIKKQVSKYRKLLSNPLRHTKKGKWFPTVGEIHQMWYNGHTVDEMLGLFKLRREHLYKKEYVQLLRSKLTYIDNYRPPKPPRHEDYGQFPLGHYRWVDEQGNDIWKSQRADAKLWVKRHPKVKKWHSRGKE